jgi:putative addiction module CopG family antidote
VNITLDPELERTIRERIERGDYDNVDSLVDEAVHRLIEEDELDVDALRKELRRADAEIERGEGLEFDEQTTRRLAEDIRTRGLKRLQELPYTGPRG